jgi:hypothetical protein
MKDVICFPHRIFEKPICIRIYYDVIPFKKPIPELRPWDRKLFEDLNEHFSEIIAAGSIKKETVVDVAILSAIAQLTKQLSPNYAKELSENLKVVNKQINAENEGFNVKIG